MRNKKVGVAVSGGPDSMVLLDLLSKCKEDLNMKLFALHYNHKWRKKSHKDALLVKDFCKINDIKFVYGEFDGIPDKDEETARNLRYSFFKNVAAKQKIDVICTAHHKDDQIETILFRLVRGTGPRGLLPIKKILKLTDSILVYRPILDMTKDDIYSYLRKTQVPYVEDCTNKDLNYKRNLIRHKIIPELNKINSNAAENILLCSDLIYSQNTVLETSCRNLLKEISEGVSMSWSRRKFIKLDVNVQKTFLYWFLSEQGFKGAVSKLEMILKSIDKVKTIDLNKEYFLKVTHGKILFERKENKKSHENAPTFKQNFYLNGNKAEILFDASGKNKFVLRGFTERIKKNKFPKDKEMKAFVDLSSYLKKNLSLRYRKPSDIFQPLGFHQTLKLKNYLINKKISVKERYNIPMLCFNDEVLWLPGYSLSEKIKVKTKPTHLLKIVN